MIGSSFELSNGKHVIITEYDGEKEKVSGKSGMHP